MKKNLIVYFGLGGAAILASSIDTIIELMHKGYDLETIDKSFSGFKSEYCDGSLLNAVVNLVVWPVTVFDFQRNTKKEIFKYFERNSKKSK